MTQMSFKGMGDKAWIYKRLIKIREGLAGGFAVFTVHFPIMLWFYYEFPIYSFLLNLLIIPAMGMVMILGLDCGKTSRVENRDFLYCYNITVCNPSVSEERENTGHSILVKNDLDSCSGYNADA